MINICLCGTSLLWPFVLLFHVTRVEPIHYNHIRWLIISITLVCALGKRQSLKIKRSILNIF
jgi:hypothetical protein